MRRQHDDLPKIIWGKWEARKAKRLTPCRVDSGARRDIRRRSIWRIPGKRILGTRVSLAPNREIPLELVLTLGIQLLPFRNWQKTRKPQPWDSLDFFTQESSGDN